MIGERSGPADRFRRLFVAEQDGQVLGYISFSPVYGSRPGWLHDLTRRRPDAPPGVMELIVAETMDRLRPRMAPAPTPGRAGCTSDSPRSSAWTSEHRVADSRSPPSMPCIGLLARHGEKLYPAADQVAYKLKWRPHLVQPDYLAFHGRPRRRRHLAAAPADPGHLTPPRSARARSPSPANRRHDRPSPERDPESDEEALT